MIELAPRFILEQSRLGRHAGRFGGTGVFVDLVGFTSMTESLMVHGPAGAEQVCAAINRVFEPAVHATYSHGGWVAKYAGDAFLALFPAGARAKPARAAREITLALSGGHLLETSRGEFPIAARVGIGRGVVSWGIVPAFSRLLFFFAGSAIRRAIVAQAAASPGSWAAEPGSAWVGRGADDGDDGGGRDEPAPSSPARRRAPHPPRADAVAPFVPREILDLGTGGEFREIACVFLGFEGLAHPVDWRAPEALARVMHVVGEEVSRYGGYLSELDFGDKGNVVVIYFGAPRGLERPMPHALGFATSLRDRMRDEAMVRIGVTQGRVFAGLVGSPLRAEYKAVGRTVNLAARLMAASAWGSIVLDDASAAGVEGGFDLARCGEVRLKGIPAPVQAHAVMGVRRGRRRARTEGGVVGRDDDLVLLRRRVAEMTQSRGARVMYIDGVPGIGKSRLVAEARDACASWCTWFSLSCDDILRESLNPFGRWAAEYFEYDANRSPQENRRAFARRMDRLAEAADEESRGELARTHSILAALAGIREEHSLHEQLDAKGRFANLAIGLTHLFKTEASRRPVVLELEDCHWIDRDSTELLRRIMRGLKTSPVLVLATARPNDDGSPFRLPVDELPVESIRLDALSHQSCVALAHAHLGTRPSGHLADFLWAKSEGNPFYLEQLLLLLKGSGAVRVVRGVATLVSEPKDLPGTVSALIVARVDRLPPRLRRAATVASVIGSEFTAPVLAAMLGMARVAPLLEAGRRNDLWKERADGRYAFAHALIRDSLYQIQLTKERARLHLQAGSTIERVYAAHLEHHYGALAYHFDAAADHGKARFYLEKAAEAAEASFSNVDALRFLERLASYATSPAEVAEFSLRRGKVLDRVGRLDDALAVLEAGMAAAEAGDPMLRVRLATAVGDVLIQQGEIERARELYALSLQMSEEHGEDVWCSISQANLGRVHRAQGDLGAAAARYREAIRLAVRGKDRRAFAHALGNLGNIHYVRGELRKAQRCYRRCLEVSKDLDDLYSVCRCESAMGLVRFQRGEYGAAARHFHQQIAVARQIGDQGMLAKAEENMGLLYERAGEWERAAESFLRTARLCEEMGSRGGIATSLAMAARVYLNADEYERGIALSDRAVALARELGMKAFLVHFLTDRGCALMRKAVQTPPGPVEEAEALCVEAIELARQLGMSNALFLPTLARLRLEALRGSEEDAIVGLRRMAGDHPDANDQALIHEAIAWITRDPQDIRDAFNRYRALYQEDPDHAYYVAMVRLADLDEADGPTLLAEVKPARLSFVFGSESFG